MTRLTRPAALTFNARRTRLARAARGQRRSRDREAAPLPEFDLAICRRSIRSRRPPTSRAFLSPGVPKELARAALRRAWSADPAIRDFVGLAENAWDFTDPTAMAGFGELLPGYDVKKLVAQIFGDGEKPADPGATADEPSDSASIPLSRRKSQRQQRRPKLRHQPPEKAVRARQIFQTNGRSLKTILCSAITMLHRTIVIRRTTQKRERTAVSMAVHCLNRKSYHSLRLLTRYSVGQYLYIEII